MEAICLGTLINQLSYTYRSPYLDSSLEVLVFHFVVVFSLSLMFIET